MQLIHWGASKYDPELFKPISDAPFDTKPIGGLWASPVNSDFGWKEWTEIESYGETNEYFNLEFNGDLLVIDTLTDLGELPWIECDRIHFISFQAMCAGGFSYDAIHLTEAGERATRWTRPRTLYGWDCECVLVLNPDSIRPAQ